MKQTKNSILTRVLAMMLCVVMLAGTLTACFNDTGVNNGNGTSTDANTSTTTPDKGTTGDSAEKDPVEDPVDPNEIFSASATLEDGALIYGTLASGVIIGDHETVGAIVPADVKIEDGASSLALSIKNVEGSDVVFADYESVHSLDVHVSGIAADNTVPMIVNLGAVLEARLEETELKLYHMENGTAVLMTRVDSLNDFAIHNQYCYNAETGEVSIYVASFSVFSAVQTTVDKWNGTSDTAWYNENDTEFTLTTAEELAGFRELVDGGNTFAGKTIKLAGDMDLELYETVTDENGEEVEVRVSFDPIGFGYYNAETNTRVFMGTFDGAGHTIYNLYQNGWDLGYSYSTAGGGLFASVKDATIKNLAMSGANIVMECIDMGTVVGYAQGNCTFENIVVTASKLANYQRYTGGVVGEVSYGDMNAEYTHIFRNITVDSSVKVSSLWGDFDNACGGVIGGKWGDAKVLMQNVTVACEIDAFSDVTAAYQWYAYRRCGMLIGHTEQNSPKKALNAAAEFLTCENVNVYYGDWVNYNYYQFTNQSVAWQNNYPWVRAEAGEHNGALSNVRYGNPVVDGNAINTIEAAETNKTSHAVITFNQLYGGGQGVYGAADHAGVTTHDKLTKTVYIKNTLGWTNLKLHYWFKNGEDTWSTIVDGVDMSTMLLANNIYKVDLPAYANGFKIVGTYKSTARISTNEILLSEVMEKNTYSLNAFHITLNIEGADSLIVPSGNWLYNTQVNNGNVPDAAAFDLIIYDENYTGTFTTNGYGIAIVLDANGKLIKIYDGANSTLESGAFYEKAGEKTIIADFNVNTYATFAWSELEKGQTLIIFPNKTNDKTTREWALGLRAIIGNTLTIDTGINTDIHTCSNVCERCGGCTDFACEECADNRCTCLVFAINGNEFVALDGKWFYNTQVNNTTTPKAMNYQMIVYDKSYTGTFTTNNYGVALVIDADGKLVKGYAWDGYYTASGIASITDHYTVDNYATTAFDELAEGEILIIFPNDGKNAADSARTFAKNICDNWETTMGQAVILTGNLNNSYEN